MSSRKTYHLFVFSLLDIMMCLKWRFFFPFLRFSFDNFLSFGRKWKSAVAKRPSGRSEMFWSGNVYLINLVKGFVIDMQTFMGSSICMGAFNNYVNFAIFWPTPLPCVDSFCTLSKDKNKHFWPPRSYWIAPIWHPHFFSYFLIPLSPVRVITLRSLNCWIDCWISKDDFLQIHDSTFTKNEDFLLMVLYLWKWI